MAGAGDPREAAAAFCRDARTCRVEPLGFGNINDTFVVNSAEGSFVLQKINGRVFPEPLKVIRNFQKITSHLLGRQQEHGPIFQTAQSVRTLQGELFYRDPEGGYWRAQTYLAGTPFHVLSGTERITRAGRALALFHLLSEDLDVAGLEDPLPGFHNLPGYMEEFERVLTNHHLVMDEEYDYCLAVLDRVGPRMSALEDARQAGILAIQPIHGDPKIDNFIFSGGGEADGMLDFDTVGAGLIHYDLGDCLRSCCNKAGEKGPDTSSVSLDLEYCRLFLQGYFSSGPHLLRETQRDFIYEAVLLISFELGVRFFTDHLRGNTYFKVAHDGENLLRAIRQFRLVDDIAGKEKQIRLLVSESRR